MAGRKRRASSSRPTEDMRDAARVAQPRGEYDPPWTPPPCARGSARIAETISDASLARRAAPVPGSGGDSRREVAADVAGPEHRDQRCSVPRDRRPVAFRRRAAARGEVGKADGENACWVGFGEADARIGGSPLRRTGRPRRDSMTARPCPRPMGGGQARHSRRPIGRQRAEVNRGQFNPRSYSPGSSAPARDSSWR